ncbi:hypothetical protein DL96DRAFT_1698148 [Flagelloscypha sp. PMI_526]|nr:hypothetical protein DL96DRAFT_1698148 [Flagelloscypha sp. PMI_526]
MKDWSSAPQVMRDANAFVNLMHVLLGLYIWELFVSRDFDWEIFSAKRRFRWPMIIYFLNRFLLLFALIGIAVALNVTTPIDCQSLYTFNQLTGMASVGLASINLSIRTMAVWMHNRWVVGLLSTLILGHWSLILQGALLTAVFIPGQGCIIINTNDTVLVATFIYGMCFDFVVLLLNAWRLCNLPETLRTDAAAFGYTGWHKSKLGRLIFRDGLIYFVVAFLANLLATIFMLLHLNAIMDVIFMSPRLLHQLLSHVESFRD